MSIAERVSVKDREDLCGTALHLCDRLAEHNPWEAIQGRMAVVLTLRSWSDSERRRQIIHILHK